MDGRRDQEINADQEEPCFVMLDGGPPPDGHRREKPKVLDESG